VYIGVLWLGRGPHKRPGTTFKSSLVPGVSWFYAEKTFNSTAGGRTPLKRVLHLTQF